MEGRAVRFRTYPSHVAVSCRGMSRATQARDKTIPVPYGNKGNTLLLGQKQGSNWRILDEVNQVRSGGESQKCLHGRHRRNLMSNSIVITIPHRLGAEEAKRRIAEQLEHLRRDYIDKLAYSEVNWDADTADLRVVALGQTVTGKICVMSDSLRIEVQLPWICRPHRQDPRRSQEQSGGIVADRVHPAKGLNRQRSEQESKRQRAGANCA